MELKHWQCILCDYVYDEAEGVYDEVPPDTPWADLLFDWQCPQCDACKDNFICLDNNL